MPATDERLKEAAKTLREQGQRLTPQRLELLRLLIEAREPLSAYELHARVRAVHPHVSLDTVYRNLFMLTTSGLVGQINLQNREAARFEFQGDAHHHHAVCLSCGKTFGLELCPAEHLAASLPSDMAFRPVNHVFEVYGYCSSCQ